MKKVFESRALYSDLMALALSGIVALLFMHGIYQFTGSSHKKQDSEQLYESVVSASIAPDSDLSLIPAGNVGYNHNERKAGFLSNNFSRDTRTFKFIRFVNMGEGTADPYMLKGKNSRRMGDFSHSGLYLAPIFIAQCKLII